MLLEWKSELKSVMSLLGAKTVPELTQKSLLIQGELHQFAALRHVNIDHLANRT
ncbi:isopentenyl pyrophosphate isomerase [Listeria cornellensis FSL F6-0969]|uniref:Isopentenyl pyrophosphate isomerase n=1 Tax=Listeria cornellensis FSL F6-0969 TaxID=1265820 RepID=W7C558_9LIST|nr:hypothetical protein [Listeria cornellensis]EUJ30786.1 isopentenyl pyrophosphate isomerase [Listeria cornellensis FSL F6-0969]